MSKKHKDFITAVVEVISNELDHAIGTGEDSQDAIMKIYRELLCIVVKQREHLISNGISEDDVLLCERAVNETNEKTKADPIDMLINMPEGEA